MTEQETLEQATCGVAKMVYSKYQKDRYGLREGKRKYDKFEIKRLQLKKDLIDFGIPCAKLKIIKIQKLPFLLLDDVCTPSANAADIAFEYHQVVPSTVWVITHPLQFKPNITVVDNDGYNLDFVAQYPTSVGVFSPITLTFSIPVSGWAYLS